MGLFDAFGVGGGSLSVQLQFPQAQAGGVVHGVATFQGGRRAQQITSVTAKLTVTTQVPQNGQMTQQTRDLVAPVTLAGPFTAQPGQAYQFQFQFQVPADAYGSAPNLVSYRVTGNADIDGEIDPGAGVELQVVGNAYQPQGMIPMGGPVMAPTYGKDPYASKGGYAPQQGGYDPKGNYAQPQKGGYDPNAKGGYAQPQMGGAFAPGASVSAQWSDGGYYRATVAAVKGDQVLVQWEDGSPELWVHTSQVRAK
jgi:hypothetical protein